MKQLLLAYLDAGEQWPEDMDDNLKKYYVRTYIKPAGAKHSVYLVYRHEWQQTSGIVYLGNRAN